MNVGEGMPSATAEVFELVVLLFQVDPLENTRWQYSGGDFGVIKQFHYLSIGSYRNVLNDHLSLQCVRTLCITPCGL